MKWWSSMKINWRRAITQMGLRLKQWRIIKRTWLMKTMMILLAPVLNCISSPFIFCLQVLFQKNKDQYQTNKDQFQHHIAIISSIRYSFDNSMQNQKENKVVQLTIPPLHTYMVKEDDYTSTDEMKVSLISGQAQILGMELKKHYPLKYKMPCIVLIFTWEGCEIKVEWPEDKTSRSSDQWCDITLNNHLTESPMIKYLNLHYDLTVARKLAHEEVKRGPRLAIVGGQNAGTAFVSRLMLNYTGKLNMKPIFIDLDLDNSIFLDGAIGAAAYQYRSTTSQDLFEKCQKICYIYGNRKIRTSSFMKVARQLSKYTNQRLGNEMQNLKWKGCSGELSTFAAGIILQCPKISDQKKYLKQMLAQLLTVFEITHVLIIDSPDISSFLSRTCPNINRFNVSKLEGVDTLLKLPKKNKLVRYFGTDLNDLKTISVRIEEVVLYELIEGQHKSAYVRRIDIKTEHVNKTAVSILSAKLQPFLDPQQIAKRISQSPVLYGCRISKIGEEQVTFQVPAIQNFWEQCKNRIWVSMIAQKINS